MEEKIYGTVVMAGAFDFPRQVDKFPVDVWILPVKIGKAFINRALSLLVD